MSTNFFTERQLNPFGVSLFSGTPTSEQSSFFGLAGGPAYDSDISKQNVWAGLTGAYRDANSPAALQKWLSFQQPQENANYMLARQKDPSLDFAHYEAGRDFRTDWDHLDPYTAGRSNFYTRSRFQGG